MSSSSFWVLALGQLLPSHLQCHYVFKRTVQINHSSAKYLSSNFDHPWVSPCQYIFQNLIYDFMLWAHLQWIAFYRRQLIIYKFDLEIVSTLKSACLNGKFLAFDDMLHHWPSIEWFRDMFDFSSFIHISWIVLSTLRAIDITGGYSHTC